MKFSLFLFPKSIALYTAMLIVNVQSFLTEIEWIGVENSKTGIVATTLKVERFNRSTVSLSGFAILADDLSDDYDCQVNVYLSSEGNNQYVLLPYKIPRDACCKHFESIYWKSVENRLIEVSNVPKRNGKEPYCLSLKKDEFTVRKFAIDTTLIPKDFQTGTYKQPTKC